MSDALDIVRCHLKTRCGATQSISRPEADISRDLRIPLNSPPKGIGAPNDVGVVQSRHFRMVRRDSFNAWYEESADE